ncbi:DoxX family protein [Solirubrobacter phytolaccae]|uniref:DoxX family protein n=1 Tax=Solirubrobacter phytolaccae TaxID=1404360 RepID=A0A9X3NDH6_9ACTN|nr:DoxX family protein [Solirubrobacter phytolaccae]MDA0182880.1 DoxX family protein [Solirubrobacter phytolaccae]
MTVAYWVLAGLLAVFYVYSGSIKAVRSKAQLAPMMHWVETTPLALIRFIGVVELLGAVGLIVPRLLDIAPWLAVVAAVGLAVLQVLAGSFHLSRGERAQAWLNVVLIVLAAVTAWLAAST